MSLMTVDDIKGQMELYRKDVASVVQYTKTLEVKSKGTAKEAINYIARARKLSSDINKKKLEITKEARDYVSKINAIAKEFIEPLELVEDMILAKIDSWKIEYAESLEAIEAEEFDLMQAFDSIDTISTGEAKLTDKIKYDWKIEDIRLIPLQYLTIDEDKFQDAMKKGIRNIPGVEILQKKYSDFRRNSR